MHRIDSPNARPNLNGPGKTGFSDNTDLTGQDATYLSPDWFNAVQEELAGVVEASGAALNKGDNGQLLTALHAIFASNDQMDEVDSRLSAAITALSVATQQAIVDERNRLYPIGTGLYVVYDDRNPVDTLGWGTWELVSKGRALVGLTDDSEASTAARTVGAEMGSATAALSADSLPPHAHGQNWGIAGIGESPAVDPENTGDADGYVTTTDYVQTAAGKKRVMTDSAGTGAPFSILPPSFVVAVWRRVG